MGIHSISSNRKTTNTQRNRNKIRRAKRRDVKKLKGVTQGDILDADIITVHHLKKRKSDPKCNITLSKKKRRKIMKQIEYAKKDKAKMDVDLQAAVPTSSKTKKSGTVSVEDVEMKE